MWRLYKVSSNNNINKEINCNKKEDESGEEEFVNLLYEF